MATTLICKITHKDETRRFTSAKVNTTYASVHKRTKEFFNLNKSFKFTYTDDESDIITMSTEEEMAEAIEQALAKEPAILRLQVKLNVNETGPDRAQPPAPATPTAASEDTPGTPDLSLLFRNFQEALPAIAKSLPPEMAKAMGKPEEAAKMAAKCAAKMAKCAEKFGLGYGDAGVHPGVTCDKSGQCPIVGTRYHLTGFNYDLCEAEFAKLSPEEQAKFEKIDPPSFGGRGCGGWRGPRGPCASKFNSGYGDAGVHPGVTCDKTGQCPIVGMRYHLTGHDYDLCEAEFAKLSSEEQAKFEKINPPAFGRGCGGGRGWRGPFAGKPDFGPKLAARFVSDVTVFDGTQVAPNTRFTKIWRLKNTGETSWPPGTTLLFVGGDQMSAEMTVPLTSKVVLPGEEVDVAVDMVAPAEAGRYIGYWRLTGSHCRRRFGQRIWAHVQVVDPEKAPMAEEDIAKATADIANLMAAGRDNEDDEMPDDATPAASSMAAPYAAPSEPAPAAASPPPSSSMPSSSSEPMELVEKAGVEAAAKAVDVPEETVAVESEKATAPMDDDPKSAVATTLRAMGFMDRELVYHVIEKNGADLEACARDLVAATEWDEMLSDLEEMGFEDANLNKKLMVKHNGSVKRTVKDLVADVEH